MERALWNKGTKSGHPRWSREGAPGAGRRVVWRTLHVTAQDSRRVRVAPWVSRQRARGVRPMSVSLASCSMRLSFSEQVLRQYLEARTERDRDRRLSVAPRFARGGGGGRRGSESGCGSASGLARGSVEERGRGCVRGGGRREGEKWLRAFQTAQARRQERSVRSSPKSQAQIRVVEPSPPLIQHTTGARGNTQPLGDIELLPPRYPPFASAGA
jgi:hypothetical protein